MIEELITAAEKLDKAQQELECIIKELDKNTQNQSLSGREES